MKERCAIYPYTDQFLSFLDTIENLKITYLCTPPAWKKRVTQELIVEYIFTDKFEDVLDDIDVILFCDCLKIELLYEDIVKKVKNTISHKKKVICFVNLKGIDLKEIKLLAEQNEVVFEYPIMDVELYKEKWEKYDYTEISCPVIGVGSLVSNMDTTSVIMELTKELDKRNYKTLGFFNNNNATLSHQKCFPTSFFDAKGLSVVAQIEMINKYINYFIREEKPDVLIVPFDYGLLKLSDEMQDTFGVYSYMISQAVSIDFFLLQVPINMLEAEKIEELSSLCSTRFGFSIDALAVSNKVIDMNESIENNKIELITVKRNLINEYIRKLTLNQKIPVFDGTNTKLDSRKLVDLVIDSL